MGDTPAPDEDHDVKNAGNDEEVTRKDQLMMESMSDDSKNDGQGEGYSPERDSMPVREEHSQGVQVVFESFFF